MREFMRAPIDMSCPICGSVFRASLDDVRVERTVHCPQGHAVRLVDNGDGAQRINRSLNELERTMKRAGFKIKYRRR